MSTLKIDGQELEFEPGQTIMQVAQHSGIDIPFYCWHPRLSVAANCRMCLVEVEKAPKLLPACEITCRDGMVVHTQSERALKSRRAIMEFQLINHPIDCPICDQAGECKLQNYYMDHDLQASAFDEVKVVKDKHVPLGPNVMMDEERCINCTRCVRFMKEVAKNPQLGQFDRGDRAYIGIFPGQPLDDPYSMNVVDICPVGALTSRDFRFKVRSWFLKQADSVCTGCSGGCSLTIDHYQNEVMRYRPRDNDFTNKGWMCDRSRLSYKRIHDPDTQITVPHLRAADGRMEPISWEDAKAKLTEVLSPAVRDNDSSVGLCLSAQLTTEGMAAFVELAGAVLPIDTYAIMGRPNGEGDDILQKEDKNPNRAGAEIVLEAYSRYDEGLNLKQALNSGRVKTLILAGSELPVFDEAWQEALKAATVIAFTSNWDVVAREADLVLPKTTFAEQDGSFVNFAGRMQRLNRALTPINNRLTEVGAAAFIASALGASWKIKTWRDAFFALAERAPALSGVTPEQLGEWGLLLEDEDDEAEALQAEAS